MSNGTIALIAVLVLIGLAVIVLVSTSRRRDADRAVGELSRETRQRDRTAESPELYEGAQSSRELEAAVVALQRGESTELVQADATPATWTPPDAETYGVTRRQFLNRSNVAFMGLGIAGFGAAIVSFLWGPPQKGGFGADIEVGRVDDLLAEIQANNGFLYKPEGRMWLTEYPRQALDAARQVYSQPELNGMEAGLVALYQKCPHLGCRVPSCESSQWFECPCHGSQYNQAGEKKGGPAPRGMDHFGTLVNAAGVITVQTGLIIPGAPIGTNTTGQEAEGPNCLGESSHE